MLGRLDAVPRVAGDDPAVGRLVLQRVEVLGLAGQHAHHLAVLEQAARVALAHELRQVGAEQHVEDRVGLGVGQRLHHAAGIDLAQRRRLLGDELDVGLRRLQQLLEGGHGRLAVLVVGVDHGPALLLQLGRFGHQHRGLHVGAGAQAEGVVVAVLPDDLVGQRLAGQEEELLLLGEVGHAPGRCSTGRCRPARRPSRARPAPRPRAPRRRGCALSSRVISSIFLPLTPPAALISSTASSMPFL